MLAVPGVDSRAVLPEIIDSSARAGAVSAMGDLNGAIVGAGSGDNMTAALGLGIREGDTVISLGTSGCVYGVTQQFVSDALGQINGYADATGAFMPMVTTLNAARVTDTFRNLLGVTTDRFDELALSAPPGAQGLRLVPYLDGERCPNLPNATGLMTGLRTGMGQELLARAAVEGVLCNLLEGYGLLTVRGVKGDGRLIVTGGAGKSRAFRADSRGPVWEVDMDLSCRGDGGGGRGGTGRSGPSWRSDRRDRGALGARADLRRQTQPGRRVVSRISPRRLPRGGRLGLTEGRRPRRPVWGRPQPALRIDADVGLEADAPRARLQTSAAAARAIARMSPRSMRSSSRSRSEVSDSSRRI